MGVMLLPDSPIKDVHTDNAVVNRFISIFTMKDASSQSRIIVLKNSFSMIKDRPIIGHGGGTYTYGFLKNYPPQLYEFDKALYDSSHNQLLDWTYHHGILGLIALLTFLIYFFYKSLYLYATTDKPTFEWLTIGAVSGSFAYIIQNQFSIPYTLIYLYFFFFVGLVASLWQKYEKKNEEKDTEEKSMLPTFSRNSKLLIAYGSLSIIGIGLIIWINILPLVADCNYKTAMKSPDFETRQYHIKKAIKYIWPQDSIEYQGMNMSDNFDLGKHFVERENNPEQGKVFIDIAVLEALNLSKQHPNYYHNLITLGNFYNFLGMHYDAKYFEESDNYFQQAVAYAPKYQMVYWYWGNNLMLRGDGEKAVEKFQQALDLDPKIKQSHAELIKAYEALGMQEQANQSKLKAQEYGFLFN